MKKYQESTIADDFVYISMDINGLKTANDTLGHSAGDELIRGAAECINRCFGVYGNVYRTGGDEFIAMIFADEKRLEEIERDFERTTGEWSGEKVKEIYISYGYVTKKENPDMTVLQMAEVADKRMYEAKSNYYIRNGIDRRR